MSKMGLHDPFGHLQHKLSKKKKVGNQTGNLTLDHGMSGIDPIFVRAGGMQHIVGKISTRAITSL
jgi:hypothetical protein